MLGRSLPLSSDFALPHTPPSSPCTPPSHGMARGARLQGCEATVPSLPPRLVAGHAHKTSSRRRGVSSIFFAPLLFILQVEAAVFPPPLQSGRSRPTSSLKRLDPKVEAPLEAPGRSLLVRFYRLGSPPRPFNMEEPEEASPPPALLFYLFAPHIGGLFEASKKPSSTSSLQTAKRSSPRHPTRCRPE